MAISVHRSDGRKKAAITKAGTIRRRADGIPTEVSFEMEFLDDSHIDEVLELQEIVAKRLDDKEIFRLTIIEEFRDLLCQDSSAIGVFTDEGLIAYNIISIPSEFAENFGADICLPKEELKSVVHIKAVVVHPAYRGNGLQRRLAQVHLDVVRGRGYEHVCSTVSPKNLISIENHFANGFVIKAIKMKYGGMLRYIMHKNLVRPFFPGENAVSIKVDDIDGQRRLIDVGLSGFKAQYHVDDFRIEYARDIGQPQ